MFIFRGFVRLSLLLTVAAWLVTGITDCRADDTPRLTGSYVGAFMPAGSLTFLNAAIPYIEQDNHRRLAGEVVINGNTAVHFPVQGTIAANGFCNTISTGPNNHAVIRTSWEKFGNGAGGLRGSATFLINHVRVEGTLFFFRPMTTGNTPRLNVLGHYAGTFTNKTNGAAGTVTTQIRDGTSNTLLMDLSFSNGQSFASVGDVASDGTFVGMGMNAKGNFAIIRGYIEQDNLRRPSRLIVDVQIKTPGGQTLETNSIIAILIG